MNDHTQDRLNQRSSRNAGLLGVALGVLYAVGSIRLTVHAFRDVPDGAVVRPITWSMYYAGIFVLALITVCPLAIDCIRKAGARNRWIGLLALLTAVSAVVIPMLIVKSRDLVFAE